jgi:hypothetical protein
MRILLKRDHNPDCFLRDGDVTPWVVDFHHPYFYGDKRGGTRGSTNCWLRLRCNDPKCLALALVHHGDFTDEVQRKLGLRKLAESLSA